MSLELAKAYVRIRGDSSGLRPDLLKVQNTVNTSLQNIARQARGFIGMLLGGYGVWRLWGDAMGAISEAQRDMTAELKMEAIWVSTKNAIGKTREELQQMVEEWEAVTNFEGWEIAEAMSSLLTYTVLTEEELRKIMDTSMDIAAVFGGNLRNNVQQIARMLSNPLKKGMSLGRALTDQGYYITPQQEELLKKFREQGDEEGARGVLMEILSGQEGAAKYMAGSGIGATIKMQKKIGKLKSQVGRELIPVMQKWKEATFFLVEIKYKLLSVIGKVIGRALEFNDALGGAPLKIIGAAAAVAVLTAAVYGLSGAVRALGFSFASLSRYAIIISIFVAIGYAIYKLIDWFSKTSAGAAMFARIAAVVKEKWNRLVAAVTGFVDRNRQKFSEMGEYVGQIITNMMEVAERVFNAFVGFVEMAFGATLPTVGSFFQFFIDILHGVLQVLALLTTNWTLTWEIMKTSAALVLTTVANNVAIAFSAMVGVIVGSFRAIWSVMKDTGTMIYNVFSFVTNGIIALFKGLWAGIKSKFSGGDFIEPFKREFLNQIGEIEAKIPDMLGNAQREFTSGMSGWIDEGPLKGTIDVLQDDMDRLTGLLADAHQKKFGMEIGKPGGVGKDGLKDPPGFGEQKDNRDALIKGLLEGGRYGFTEIGSKFQDEMLKGKDDKDEKQIALMEIGNKLQEEQLKVMKDKLGAAPALAE